jgi:hypothetical protein
MGKVLNTIARALGALCGAALAVVWAFALWVPAAGLNIVGVSVVVALMLSVFGLFAAIASLRGHATVVVLLFLASFFPVGTLSFALTRHHWFYWVGWLDIGLIVAAVPMWLTRTVAPPAPDAVN